MLNKTSLIKNDSFSTDECRALLQLFKLVPLTAAANTSIRTTPAEQGLKVGLAFVNRNGALYSDIPTALFNIASALYADDHALFNETFYKNFTHVRDASPMRLLFDQMAHYLSTYGAEAVGIKVPTYIPISALELPEVFDKRKRITVIQITNDEACIERLNTYLKTLTAPSTTITANITALLKRITLNTDDIKSFEIQVLKHNLDGTVPSNPVSQLRYLVYSITGETILIKNKNTRMSIKSRNGSDTAYNILSKCDLTKLSSIFLRFKPIFLAFKTHRNCAPIINKLRRLADTYHKPLNDISLQNLTATDDTELIKKIISRASIRELVKVFNAVMIRNTNTQNVSIPAIYSIRNGKTFVKEDGLKSTDSSVYIATLTGNEIVKRAAPLLMGKVFYIPSYIDYAVPTTEKQFVGNIPYGSKITRETKAACTIGIHWFNQKDERTDIDLHLNSATQHFGWNSSYRDGSSILYTGDQTNAPEPKGAAEAYWFNPNKDETYVVTANNFTSIKDAEFKFFMTETKPAVAQRRFENNYTYNPNEALFPAIPLYFDKTDNSMTIGMLHDNSFYFYGGALGGGIVPTANYEQFIRGLTQQVENKLMLKTLLHACGATILNEEAIAKLTPEELANVISLAPEDLEIDTLFKILGE